MEGIPQEPAGAETHKGKFSSDRDELLSIMCANGWADQSSGDIEATTGWFGRITNQPEDVESLADAFQEDVERLGSAALDAALGHFLIEEDGQGFVHVTSYEQQKDLIADYRIRQEVYETEVNHHGNAH